ncbi:DUF3137 domain-containing protein [Cellulomonas edaphi]|uniref:DUF3137 domain-containing protein n=1 Tax=Cellulomonas edaphi TaxID=3053468 RepID=A0ABT7S2A2_9CELL|nr:DUF3137 domain-containing protein [Cellulomons edaphi]MDM7829742.1 DUF3137 domain-containing protein [Cellulomons edaphi]
MVWLVLALALLVAAGAWYTQRKRLEAIAAWARASGWSFVGRDDSLAYRWAGEPFGTGDEREAVEVMTGTYAGADAVSFTYRSTRIRRGSDGKTERSTTTHHVVALTLPAALSTVEVTPEGIGARLAKMVGAQDVQFESEEFNRAYRVEGTDPQVVHAVIHPRLMERLLEPGTRGTAWRIEGSTIVSWHPGATAVDRIAGTLALLAAVRDAVPRHVWLDHGYDPAAAH